MNNSSRFRLADLFIVICIFLLLGAFILPAVFCSAGRSRESVCRNNLKLIGTGLELWKQHAERYPHHDFVGILCSAPDLAPWLDAMTLQKFYTPENLEAHRTQLSNQGISPETFTKTIDDDKIFMCPSDHRHPHRINQSRSYAWNFWRSAADDGYEYSYALSFHTYYAKFHQRADQQMLSADGLWTWSHNFSGDWVTNPNLSFDSPTWYCNTVGYWHKRNSANILLRDLHVENHKYPPDTTKVFQWESGESLYIYQ